MNNFLEEIDHSILLAINACHTPFLDEVMWFVSLKLTWIPLYLFLIYLTSKKLTAKQVVVFSLMAIITVIFADLIANYCFKEVVMRYRPSHNLLLGEKLHFYENKPGEFYKGGQYGFVSSHAANFFAATIFIGLALKSYYPKLIYGLLLISLLVCYSRLYLGVHYPTDIIAGATVGCITALLCYRFIYRPLSEKLSVID